MLYGHDGWHCTGIVSTFLLIPFFFLDLTLFRVDFIENPRLCCTNFLEHRYEIIHHAAGWDAFRSWILVSERMGSLQALYLLRNVNIILGSQIQQLPHTKRDDFYHRAVQPESGTCCGLRFISVRSANYLGSIMHRGLSLDVIQEHGFQHPIAILESLLNVFH